MFTVLLAPVVYILPPYELELELHELECIFIVPYISKVRVFLFLRFIAPPFAFALLFFISPPYNFIIQLLWSIPQKLYHLKGEFFYCKNKGR